MRRSRRCGGGQCCWCRAPYARTSAAGKILVCGAVGADHADSLAAAGVTDFAQLFAGVVERCLPANLGQLAIGLANEGLGQPFGVVGKVEGVAALDAEEISVDPALVAVVAANDLHAFVGAAHAECGLAAVAAVGADGGDVVHLPWACLVAIGAGGERADRADVDAHAALFAVEMVAAVGRDHAGDSSVLHAQRPDVHAFAAYADAAIAEDTARPIEEDYRRPLLFFTMLLNLGIERFGRAVLEGHVLEFTFAPGIADRAIERMVAKQDLHGRFARLNYFVGLGKEDLALGDGGGACRLELRHFFLAHHAHAACAAQRKPGIVAKRRNLDARGLACLDEQSSCRGGDFFAVYCETYVSHWYPLSCAEFQRS